MSDVESTSFVMLHSFALIEYAHPSIKNRSSLKHSKEPTSWKLFVNIHWDFQGFEPRTKCVNPDEFQ